MELDPEGPDALVSCAADLVVGPFLETPIEAWRRLYEVNVLGAVRGMQALLPAMVRRRRGAVVAVCSVDSLFADDQLSAYATSKAALLHAVRSAALEHARDGLRINAVCPGSVDTALLRRAVEALRGDASPEDVLTAASARIPAGRILQPTDVVGAIRFLLSEDAAMMSGAALVVDGGLTTSYEFARE